MDARSIAASRRHVVRASVPFARLEERALALWPRVDRARLARCAHDPARIASFIAREMRLPRHTVLGRLLGTAVPRREADLWFG